MNITLPGTSYAKTLLNGVVTPYHHLTARERQMVTHVAQNLKNLHHYGNLTAKDVRVARRGEATVVGDDKIQTPDGRIITIRTSP